MDNQQPRRSLLGSFPITVALLAALAAAGYGIYLIVTDQARTIGIFLVGLGLVFLPIRVLAMIGSAICVGAGVYSFVLYGVGLRGVVFLIVGLMTMADHARAIADERESAAKRNV